jgi:hypothetical protein
MPATVSFRYNDDAVGWAPLAPQGVGDWPLDYWTYVPPAYLVTPGWGSHVIVGPRLAVVHARTRPVPIALRSVGRATSAARSAVREATVTSSARPVPTRTRTG